MLIFISDFSVLLPANFRAPIRVLHVNCIAILSDMREALPLLSSHILRETQAEARAVLDRRSVPGGSLSYFPFFVIQFNFNFQTLLVIPLTVMLQYGERAALNFEIYSNCWEGTQHIATLIVSLLDLTTLTVNFHLFFKHSIIISQLLLTCYRQSQHYYRTQFAKVNLNVRYQVVTNFKKPRSNITYIGDSH